MKEARKPTNQEIGVPALKKSLLHHAFTGQL